MSRISSIFEGFVPPPTPGAPLAKYEHRQKPQAKAVEDQPGDELQLQQSLATAAENVVGGAGDLSGHYDTTNDSRASFRSSIDEKSGLEPEDKVKEPEYEGSSSEAEEAIISSEGGSAIISEANNHVRRSKPKDAASNKSSVTNKKRGRPAKDNFVEFKEPQPRKKQRLEAGTAGKDTSEIQPQLEQVAAREEGLHEQGESAYAEVVSGASHAKKGRGRPQKNDAYGTKITTIAGADEGQKGMPRVVVDSSNPLLNPDNTTKEHPRKVEGRASAYENQDLSTEDIPKRGRGRPRKPVDPNASLPDPSIPKRGRGRPRKPVDPNAPHPDPDVPKRGRGRPRKPVDPNATPTDNTPKRGRGRPRKNMDPETAVQDLDTDTSKKDKGQSRKSEELGAQSSQDAQEAEIASKDRGRPPKAKSVIPNQNEAADGNAEDCLRVE